LPRSSPFSNILDIQNTQCRSQWPRGLKHGSAACWGCRFESRQGHGYLSPESVARSKTWFLARTLAGIAGSNPAEGMDVCLLRVLCVVT
jgi:hypothetical protein